MKTHTKSCSGADTSTVPCRTLLEVHGPALKDHRTPILKSQNSSWRHTVKIWKIKSRCQLVRFAASASKSCAKASTDPFETPLSPGAQCFGFSNFLFFDTFFSLGSWRNSQIFWKIKFQIWKISAQKSGKLRKSASDPRIRHSRPHRTDFQPFADPYR